jgi:hypothetical protein
MPPRLASRDVLILKKFGDPGRITPIELDQWVAREW